MSSQINKKISVLQKFFVMMAAIALISTVGLSGAYAQTPSVHHGQGSQGQQFSQHGNFTGHQHAPGGTYSGTFTRNGTANGMNSFNHTKTAYPGGNNATSHTYMPSQMKPVLPSGAMKTQCNFERHIHSILG